jgi:DNA-binding response OmpR family regulator
MMMKGHILVVDDEASARHSLAEILRLEGYQVKMAANGASAIKLMEEETYDLVLLDIIMPGMGGMEVLRRARELAPDTHIILLTAHGSLDTAVEALRKGAHDYLLKPASPQEILDSVGKAISQRTESEQKKRILQQLETAIYQLKDAEGLETAPVPQSKFISLGEGIKIDLERREIWQGEKKVTLTPTEGKLMKVLLENQGRVLTHRELVLMVQGYNIADWEAPDILRPLVSRLRRKLDTFPGGKDWIVNVRGTGYLFEHK